MSYTKLPSKASLKPTKFEAQTSDEQIRKFKQLLSLSELGPKTYENTTDEKYFGVSYEFIEHAKKYWEQEYDWRQTEKRINSYPNYTVQINDDDSESYDVHFIALFSDKKDAVPITFLHGWPGSVLEFLDLLDVVKQKYPSPADLPYHIVVPSLPGYCYSSNASLKKNMRMQDQASVIDKLMRGLGFEDGYIAQGGDVGSFLSRILAAKYPSCKGAHLNMCPIQEPKDIPESAIHPLERKALERRAEFRREGFAYALEHGTRPATIGFALSSNPLALLAWIAEKFHTWTDTTPPLNHILDNITLYWHTQTFARCIFIYRQLQSAIHDNPEYNIAAPKVMGFSFFPKELGPVPIAWIATTGNLIWSKRHEHGGHFAAMEEPETLWSDVEEFVKAWKKGGEGAKL